MRRLLFIALVCCASEARADDTHYHDYPLGGRAVGLGGAFVAIASDASGLFYNPAGLVEATKGSVQISTNLYGIEVNDSFFSAVERANLEAVATELNIIPSSASFVGALERDRMGRAITSYAIGSFVPSFRNSTRRSTVDLPMGELGGCTQLAYSRDVADRTFLVGAAFSHRLLDWLRVGISGFLSYRTLNDREVSACSTPTEDGTAFADAETNLRLAVGSVILAAGVQADLGNGFSVGAKLSAPSVRAIDFADITVRQTSANPTTSESTFLREELRGLDADTKTGTTLRVGAAWVKPRRATIAADLVFHAPTEYTLFEVEDRRVAEAVTTVTEVRRNFVANVNVGAEYLLSRTFSLSLGFFTNFSSAPKIVDATTDQLARVNGYGGSAVLGFFGGDYTLTRVGLTMSYGTGNDVVPTTEGLGVFRTDRTGDEFEIVDVSQWFLFFFVSSTFRY